MSSALTPTYSSGQLYSARTCQLPSRELEQRLQRERPPLLSSAERTPDNSQLPTAYGASSSDAALRRVALVLRATPGLRNRLCYGVK
jgi:hypothetical protein